jgi:hypothetical protein
VTSSESNTAVQTGFATGSGSGSAATASASATESSNGAGVIEVAGGVLALAVAGLFL